MFDSDFLLLALIVWWIAASFAVMVAAAKRGFSDWRWLLAAFFLGPAFAALLLIAHPPKHVAEISRQAHPSRKRQIEAVWTNARAANSE
jgi:hypothetical protein